MKLTVEFEATHAGFSDEQLRYLLLRRLVTDFGPAMFPADLMIRVDQEDMDKASKVGGDYWFTSTQVDVRKPEGAVG